MVTKRNAAADYAVDSVSRKSNNVSISRYRKEINMVYNFEIETSDTYYDSEAKKSLPVIFNVLGECENPDEMPALLQEKKGWLQIGSTLVPYYRVRCIRVKEVAE